MPLHLQTFKSKCSYSFNISKRVNSKLQRKQTNTKHLNCPCHTVTVQKPVNHYTVVFLKNRTYCPIFRSETSQGEIAGKISLQIFQTYICNFSQYKCQRRTKPSIITQPQKGTVGSVTPVITDTCTTVQQCPFTVHTA